MKKTIPLIVIICAAGMHSFGQVPAKQPSKASMASVKKTVGFHLPPVKNDTLYLNLENILELNSDSKLVSASAENAHVEVKGNNLLLVPTQVGKTVVTIVYADHTDKKSFYSTPLPLQR